MDSGVTTMGRCSFFVLDEADRMLDMGYFIHLLYKEIINIKVLSRRFVALLNKFA